MEKLLYDFTGTRFARRIKNTLLGGRKIIDKKLSVQEARSYLEELDESVDIQIFDDMGYNHPRRHETYGTRFYRDEETPEGILVRVRELGLNEEEAKENGITITHQAYNVLSPGTRQRTYGKERRPWRWERHYLDIKQTKNTTTAFEQPVLPRTKLEFMIDPKTKKGLGTQQRFLKELAKRKGFSHQ